VPEKKLRILCSIFFHGPSSAPLRQKKELCSNGSSAIAPEIGTTL
jgi:hypothetical protein